MGIPSAFPGPSDGLLPFLMVSTVLAISALKRVARSFRGTADSPTALELEEVVPAAIVQDRVLITRFKSLYHRRKGGSGNQAVDGRVAMDCCVCLCRFEAEEEVSELVSCKHFFHKGCLQKWFHNRGNTTSSCPLCRSLL